MEESRMFSCSSGDQPEAKGSQGCACCGGELQSLTRRINADLSRRGFVAGIGASLAALGLPRAARAQGASNPTPPIVFTNFLLFDGKSNALRGGLASHRRRRADQGGRDRDPSGAGRGAHDRLRRPRRDAGTDRRALALHFRRAADPNSDFGGGRLYLPGRQRRGGAHADARLHHDSGPRRPLVRAQTGDRRRTRAGTAHLSVRRHDHDDGRSWRHASPLRSAAEPWRPSELHGADRRRQYRRQRRRSAPAGRASSSCRAPPRSNLSEAEACRRRARRWTC